MKTPRRFQPTIDVLADRISPSAIVPVHTADTDPVEKGGLTPIIIGVPVKEHVMVA